MNLSNLFKYIFFVTFCLLCLNFTAFASQKNFTIVIDAGHGGKDAGAIDNGIREKTINLDVALKVADLIKKRIKMLRLF